MAVGSPDQGHALFDQSKLREQSWSALARAERGESEHFAISHTALLTTVTRLAADLTPTIEREAPPLNNCWYRLQEHFADDLDMLASALGNAGDQDRARSGLDLALLTTLADPTGRDDARFVEIVQNFAAGEYMSAERGAPALDGDGLRARLDDGEDLPSWENAALQRCVDMLSGHPELFGENQRFGNILGPILDKREDGKISADNLFQLLAPVTLGLWPSPTRHGRDSAGDAWRAAALLTGNSLISFQAPVLRLIEATAEPLLEAGCRQRGLSDLAATPTLVAANALLQSGILEAKHSAVTRLRHPAGSDIMVECRCLTIAILDRLADHLSKELRCTTAHLPAQRIIVPLLRMIEDADTSRPLQAQSDLF